MKFRFWKSATGGYGGRGSEPLHHPVRAEVLAVEDSEDEMEFLCGLLRLQGAVVTRARNIAGAIDAIAGPVQFQIAFVDLNLANSSGIEIVRRIRQNKRGTHPVVVSGDVHKIQLCLDWGYVGVLKKPYGIDSIRQVLKAHRLPVND